MFVRLDFQIKSSPEMVIKNVPMIKTMRDEGLHTEGCMLTYLHHP
jgi:hypothetical protein